MKVFVPSKKINKNTISVPTSVSQSTLLIISLSNTQISSCPAEIPVQGLGNYISQESMDSSGDRRQGTLSFL